MNLHFFSSFISLTIFFSKLTNINPEEIGVISRYGTLQNFNHI